MQVQPYNPASLLSPRGLNTLLFSDPYAKLCFTASLASGTAATTTMTTTAKTAVYIDLDTAFSAYLAAGIIDAKGVDVYLPSKGRFMAMFRRALAQVPRYSLVILDSINSFYAVYYDHYRKDRRAGGRINHLLSVLLMLLVRQGVAHGVPVLATSMLRYRKEGEWKQSPAGRRLLQKKSACRMQVEHAAGDRIVLKVLEHDTLPAGSSYSVMPLH